MTRIAQWFTICGCGLATLLMTPLRAAEKAASSNSDSKPTYNLRYRFQPNSHVRYRVSSTVIIRQVKGSYKTTVKHEKKTDKHFDVTAVDGKGNALLEPVIDAAVLSVQFDDGPKKTYDSRSGKPPLRQFAGVATTIGKRLVRLKIAPDGRLVQAVPLIGKRTQAEVTKNHGPATPSNDPSKNFLIEFPEKPVRVGDEWTDDNLKVSLQVEGTLKLFRTFAILRTYRLESVKDGLATIKFHQDTKRPVNQPQLQVQLVQRRLKGTIVFDLKRGVIVSRKLAANNKVFGYVGPQSLLHVTMSQVERLVEKGKRRP